jgi:ferritin
MAIASGAKEEPTMPENSFADAVNKQIANEFAASQQYTAAAVYYDEQTLPRLAAFFYRQAVEERNHAMMMVRYLLDTGQEVRIPGIDAPETSFSDIVGPVSMALEQERTVTGEINDLFRLARDSGDFQGENFLQWFVKEQVEEVKTMTDLLAVVERARDDPLHGEEYLAREGVGEDGDDPTTPPAAGGVL